MPEAYSQSHIGGFFREASMMALSSSKMRRKSVVLKCQNRTHCV
jgi:hypothetical protein